ncbi:MAG: hypothetical protein NTX92_08270 [Euryarchaeota archaeon]|nr:hypothetical protein [Euryarchaeota archaeon]
MTKKTWNIKGWNPMKKITPLLIGLMLLTSVAFFAVADKPKDNYKGNTDNGQNNHTEDNETGDHENETHENYDNETEHEVEIMSTTVGATIRLLQLEKALIINLLKGVMTVQVLKGLSVNTTKLETILVDLRAVLDEVRTADPAANNSVQIFVELKNQSRNLTKQFRDTVRTLLDNETINMIKEQLRNLTSDELQNCSKNLRNQIRHFNGNQLYRLYGIIGETNTTLLNEYLNGTITLNQTKLQLHKLVNQMTKEKRYQIFTEVKEDRIKKEIRAHESIKDIEHHGEGNGHGKQH